MVTDRSTPTRWRRLKRWYLFGERAEDEVPQCHYCRHFKESACPAYPGGVPLAILSNQIDHRRTSYPLDRGLRFAPISIEADEAQRALFPRPQ